MLPVELPLTPSSPNCLAWSADGEIAIAAGEDVHLLIPRRKREADEGDDDVWNKVRFKANRFTPDEWPLQGPRPFQHVSIGEEQSESHVASIAWSPPGLALHKRSVLAVLTNNCVLSLWAAVSDPRESSSWKRIVVVNHSVDGASPSLPLQRVHCMAWAPKSRELTLSNVPFSARKWGIFLLAVALDKGVQIFDVSSVFAEFSLSSIGLFDLAAVTPFQDSSRTSNKPVFSTGSVNVSQVDGNDRPSLISAGLQTAPCVSALTFSQFAVNEKTATAILTFRYSSTIAHLEIRLASLDSPCRSSVVTFLQIHRRRVGLEDGLSSFDVFGCPAVWQCAENEWPFFALAERNEISVYLLSRSDRGRFIGSTSFTISPESAVNQDDRSNLDEINGLCFVPVVGGSSDSTWIFASTNFSKLERAEVSRRKRLGDDRDHQPKCVIERKAPIHTKMSLMMEEYDKENNTEGKVIMKTWGLASWKNLVAVCVTLHPAAMIDYRSTSDNSAKILFESGKGSVERMTINWRVFDPYQEAKGQCRVFEAFAKKTIMDLTAMNELSQKTIYGAVWLSMYRTHEESNSVLSSLVILALLEASNGIGLPRERRLLEDLASATPEERAAWPTERKNQVDYGVCSESCYLSWCSICKEQIGWTNILEASCRNGHPFARCALTFLPITEPSLVKYCLGCGRQFLNERAHPELRKGLGDGAVPTSQAQDSSASSREDSGLRSPTQKPYFVDYLFELFDTCPYCGDKYYTNA